ncbi:DEAD/DEAH box helicase, partial [Haliangium sp.]|uniref:DEAD/DEAH box helicase n=1 Tax=Haliangium sp. TaxID=2663208 RepID=UPI003D11CB38
MSHEISAADADRAGSAPPRPSRRSAGRRSARTDDAQDKSPKTDSPRDNDAVEADDDNSPEALVPSRSFADLGLEPEILQALEDMGYQRPMPVQLAVYDDMIAGHDVMVQSRTGSGKTAGFGIPAVQRLAADSRGAQVLVLAPTRELALQVSREVALIAERKGVTVVPIYGGAPIKPQMDALAAGAQFIAGTPGRVLDHLRRGTLVPDGIRTLILDECDEMLSMGFQEEIEKIIEFLPGKDERQTVLFSATIPDEIQRIARRHMNDPKEILLSADGVGVAEIDHFYYVVSGMARTRDLLRVMRAERPESAIIFCNTREDTNTVATFLRHHGYDAEAISSDLSQRDRERVMKRMRDGNLQFLVATDVAARGIDISNLSHVINYAFPDSPEVYVHRTGRTGRAGQSGVAISLVGPRELGSLYYVKLIYRITPEERDLPSPEEMGILSEGERYERISALVTEDAGQEYRLLARRVWQSSEGERIVGALLQRLLKRGGVHDARPTRSSRPQEDTRDRAPRARRDDDRPGRDDDRETRRARRDEDRPRRARRDEDRARRDARRDEDRPSRDDDRDARRARRDEDRPRR